MSRITVLHFTKIINRNDFIDIIVRNADPNKFRLLASTYQSFSNIEDPKYREEGIPHFILNIHHGWIDMFLGAWRLSRLLRLHKVDILHTHHYYESVIGMMACMLSGGTVQVVGRHYHDQFYLTTKGLKLWFYLFVEAIVNKFAKAIVVPSSLIVQLLVKQHVPDRKIKFIPYGFDFNAPRYNALNPEAVHNMRNSFGWSDKFLIGNIGRHHPIKGQLYLLNAFEKILSKIPNAILIMIGDGPIHEELKEVVSDRGLQNAIFFLGWRKDAHELMNMMDVVVHPTLQEAFPQLMIETMALAKPLIITPVSGATDVVQSGVNGFLIPFRDSKAIEDAIYFVYYNKEKANEIGRAARAHVQNHYTIQNVVPQFEVLYESLMCS